MKKYLIILLLGCFSFSAWSVEYSQEELKSATSNYERWKGMSPEQKENLQGEWKRFQSMPPKDREALTRKYNTYHSLPQERRQWVQHRAEQNRVNHEHSHQKAGKSRHNEQHNEQHNERHHDHKDHRRTGHVRHAETEATNTL